MISIRREVHEEIVKRLLSKLEYYKAITNKFEKKYRCFLDKLERKIEREGVPLDNHEIWKTTWSEEMPLKRWKS